MRVTICSNAFKECLSARDACTAMAAGLPSDVDIVTCPLADGGDSSLDVLVEAGNGKYINTTARDPLGRPITTTYGMVGSTAIIEMARASGLSLLTENEKNPLNTSTCGTGDVIVDAIKTQLATEIILCIGGSATNDCGCGMAQALGYQFFDSSETIITSPITGSDLLKITKIKKPNPDVLKNITITVACDVTNPLLGPKGATSVFGPQKGIKTQSQHSQLESGMNNISSLINKLFPDVDVSVEGGGAAGGLGYGSLTFLSATFRKGFDVCSEAAQLPESISRSDLIITGEGQIDHQTSLGKVPSGVASLCISYSKPLVIIVGGISNYPLIKKNPILGSASVFSLINKPMTLAVAMNPDKARELLSESASNIYNLYLMGRSQARL